MEDQRAYEENNKLKKKILIKKFFQIKYIAEKITNLITFAHTVNRQVYVRVDQDMQAK